MPHEELTPEPAITDWLNDLYYPSESDKPVEYVEYTIDFEAPLTTTQVRDWLLITTEVYIEEIPEEAFWEPVTTDQEWYDDEEKQRTARFIALRQKIDQFLTSRQVFRVGDGEVGLYLLGRKTDGCWAGLKTLVVET
ncbi:hypothetical protein GCM10027299_51770 [Larkinella ripae]